MSFLQKLTPINLLEEKSKFFDDPTYNPQFLYVEEIESEKLVKHGLPQRKYILLAKEILDRAYHNRNERDLLMTEGKVVSHDKVTTKVENFLKMHGLEEKIKLTWSESFISRVSITPTTIKLKSSAQFRSEDTIGMLYHEIGTHAIRRVNYEQQSWYKRKKKNGFGPYLRTEEGLAILHSLIPYSMKLAYKSALRYLVAAYAQDHSFADTWKLVSRYIEDPEKRWEIVLKQKRGLTDTSLGGGFSKSIVYFEGMVDVWKYLKQNDFDLTGLYFGKIGFEDVGKAVEMNPDFEPLLPSFYTLDKDKYAQELMKIGKENRLDGI